MRIDKSTVLLALWLVVAAMTPASAWESTDLEGKWVITSVNGEDDGDRSDFWEFRDGQWIVWMGRRQLAPDKFTLRGDTIDLGYGKIRLLSLSATRMHVETMGFKYRLERVKPHS